MLKPISGMAKRYSYLVLACLEIPPERGGAVANVPEPANGPLPFDSEPRRNARAQPVGTVPGDPPGRMGGDRHGVNPAANCCMPSPAVGSDYRHNLGNYEERVVAVHRDPAGERGSRRLLMADRGDTGRRICDVLGRIAHAGIDRLRPNGT
jgi:hypothetical protein